jgi:hypothetical protein
VKCVNITFAQIVPKSGQLLKIVSKLKIFQMKMSKVILVSARREERIFVNVAIKQMVVPSMWIRWRISRILNAAQNAEYSSSERTDALKLCAKFASTRFASIV